MCYICVTYIIYFILNNPSSPTIQLILQSHSTVCKSLHTTRLSPCAGASESAALWRGRPLWTHQRNPSGSANLVSLRLAEIALKLGWSLPRMRSISTLSVVVR